MPLWNLLGGMAKGWGDEGRYLDEEARKMRIQALQERSQGAEERYRDKSLAAEQEFRRQQMEAQREARAAEESRAGREFEQRDRIAQREHEDSLARLGIERARRDDERADRDSKKKEEEKRTAGWTEWQKMMDRVRKENPWDPEKQTQEEYAASLQYLTQDRQKLFPELWDEHLKKHPEASPSVMFDRLVGPNGSLFKGVSDSKSALKAWNSYKAANPTMAGNIPEDRVMEAIDSRFPNRGPGKSVLGAVKRQTFRNAGSMMNFRDPLDRLIVDPAAEAASRAVLNQYGGGGANW